MLARKGPACDSCRVRKVKCHGKSPCTQYAHLNLRCHFSEPAQRRPRVHGSLVAQLRGQTTAASLADNRNASFILPVDFFINLLSDYTQFVYPLNPVIPPDEIEAAISVMDHDPEKAALIYAYAAMTINRTRSSWTVHEDLAVLVTNLTHRSIKALRALESGADDLRKGVLGPLKVTISRIMTHVVLSICIFNLGQVSRSFTILREGMAMLQTLTPRHFNVSEPDYVKWQRLYWTVYINDRHMALLFPLQGGTLAPLTLLTPAIDDSIPPEIECGFRRLVALFLVLDDEFVTLWHTQHVQEPDIVPGATAEWVQRKQAELDRDATQAAEDDLDRNSRGLPGLSELQRVDISITRLWLRTMIWQLALSSGLLCSSPAHEGLSLHFPVISICKEIHPLLTQLENVTSVGYHGSGMLRKLFEITSTIAEVLNLPATSDDHQQNAARVEDLLFLVNFCLGFKAVPTEQREYLIEKLKTLQESYPTVQFPPTWPAD